MKMQTTFSCLRSLDQILIVTAWFCLSSCLWLFRGRCGEALTYVRIQRIYCKYIKQEAKKWQNNNDGRKRSYRIGMFCRFGDHENGLNATARGTRTFFIKSARCPLYMQCKDFLSILERLTQRKERGNHTPNQLRNMQVRVEAQ